MTSEKPCGGFHLQIWPMYYENSNSFFFFNVKLANKKLIAWAYKNTINVCTYNETLYLNSQYLYVQLQALLFKSA